MGHPTSAIMQEVQAWCSHLEHQGRSARTVQTYQAALIDFGRYAARGKIVAPADITPPHLTAWISRLWRTGAKPATVNLYVRVVQGWFDWLVATDRLFLSPAIGLSRPKAIRCFGRCPSLAEMNRLLVAVAGNSMFDLRDRALLEIAYATGARCEELTRLDLTSVNLASRSVVLHGKGGRDRIALLTGPAVAALDLYLASARPKFLRGREDQPALFIGLRAGRRLATAAVAQIVRRRGVRVGLVISPHDIRRAFATHLLNAGAGPAQVRDLLGHVGHGHLHHYLQSSANAALNAARTSVLNG